MSRSRKIEAVFAIVAMHAVGIAGAILFVRTMIDAVNLTFAPTPRDFGPVAGGAVFACVLLIPAVRFGWGMYQGIKDAES